MKTIPVLSFILFVFVLSLSCGKRQEQKPIAKKPEPVADARQEPPELKIRYSIITENIKHLDSHYSAEQVEVILALNRIDRKALRKLDSLIVPDTFTGNWILYSPFPTHLPILDSINKLLLFSYRLQAFAAYEQGKLVRWGPTSLGKKSTPTQTGLFHCNWRAKRTVSTIDDEWILNWYFNIDNKTGVSIHQYELPGYPASHACARLSEKDANWIYHWATQWKLSANGQKILAYGTPVIVFGSYNFSQKLHRNILDQNEAIRLPEDSLNMVIRPYLQIISERQRNREMAGTES